jgi:cell division protease FtsH
MTNDKPEKKETVKPVNGKKPAGPHLPLTQRRLEVNMQFNSRQILIWVIVLLLFVPFLLNVFNGTRNNLVPLSSLLRDTKQEKIQKVTIEGDLIRLTYKDGTARQSRKETNQDFVTLLRQVNIDPTAVEVEVKGLTVGAMVWEFVVNFLPLVVMIGFFFFLFRQARGAQGDMMGFGKSKAKFFVKGKQDVKFADVGGMQEAKQELEEIVDFLKNPKKYAKVGARTPKGVLLVGPSGTGKTLLARAVAGEANVPFLSIAGSEFMEMLVGVGASRARDLFATAKKMAPAIIFIDEIDAIGRIRGNAGGMSGHDEREQTLNQILVEMDGFAANENVIVLAATNRGDMLDPALTRPGRFDRRVMVSLPDIEERKRILSIHAKNKPFLEEVNWATVAKRTVGFSGADLENMLNEAAILIAREGREKITPKDLEEAALKVKLGPSKKRLQSEVERQMTAFHEAGHAMVAHLLPHADAVHRISIVSRGQALGFTLTPPDQDKYQETRSEMLDEISVLLGGRAAEEFFFHELTGGASSDIDHATRIVRAMVMDYGMSTLGPLNFGPQYETAYNRSYFEPYKISDQLQSKVDAEMNKIVKEAEKVTLDIITKNEATIRRVVAKLLEVETLEAEEFEALVGSPKVKSDLSTI